MTAWQLENRLPTLEEAQAFHATFRANWDRDVRAIRESHARCKIYASLIEATV